MKIDIGNKFNAKKRIKITELNREKKRQASCE